MFKMEQYGNGQMISHKDLHKAMDMKPEFYTFEKFRYMCILSGCDWLSCQSAQDLAEESTEGFSAYIAYWY